MNQLWVRISLTYIAIVIFLFLIPTAIFVTLNTDYQISSVESPEQDDTGLDSRPITVPIMERLLGLGKIQILGGLMRMLLSVSLVGMLVGVISSRGLTAPLNNLAKAARAVESQDLSQRIEVKGSSEIQEVAIAFNAMAEALEEADNLRNNMLADVAHELRTPLTVIQGNLRAILDDVYELDKVEVARLYDQTRQLSRLVDDLHDLALLEAKEFSLNLTNQSLIEIIEDVAAIYQPIFDDQEIELNLDLPVSAPEVEVDCARLTQCINNLINNALRHTPTGGSISIGLLAENNKVSILIQDDGAGIEAEHLPHIFDRFYRVDTDRNRRTGGSGLGLAITQALVQAHGGKISVFSQGRDQGSEFVIQLPVTS
jgi:signal transduction histidine kinase